MTATAWLGLLGVGALLGVLAIALEKTKVPTGYLGYLAGVGFVCTIVSIVGLAVTTPG